ncbi:hypothetical protein [Pontimicrobium sp. IMCC45349]|uniref:hypothetical protein n=1 Tax=Pontimicrobium sp. IMCC45349 TaxID=3391574 RepID=UPI00399FD34D
MEIVQLIIGIILIVSVKTLILRIIFNRIRVSNLAGDDLKFDHVRYLYKKLKKGQIPKTEKVKKFAYDNEKRILTYDVLNKFNLTSLFPKELFTLEKASESHLVNWLNFNDDFDAIPDKIEYIKNIETKSGKTVLIFKFKIYEPHVYANKDWMIGYVVYNELHTKPYSKPYFIFSKFENEILTESQITNLSKTVYNNI